MCNFICTKYKILADIQVYHFFLAHAIQLKVSTYYVNKLYAFEFIRSKIQNIIFHHAIM